VEQEMMDAMLIAEQVLNIVIRQIIVFISSLALHNICEE